ncbi:heavy metal sensor histidine kinase [Entomohabitans teleogrylli]|uniref:heavy metal sensor histidine kinase n=1 Tax=Entomohabitans teleogrylli TaxID=1384589 RepID=UPI00073D1E08|nr:heavy metal sensor histidine kinase [Entomohabitans teleogrylli]
MKRKLSLVARLSLIFSCVMLAVWWSSCFFLLSAIKANFATLENNFIEGKLQSISRLLKSEWSDNNVNNQALQEKISAALVGHRGLLVVIKDPRQNNIIALSSDPWQSTADFLHVTETPAGSLLLTDRDRRNWRYLSQSIRAADSAHPLTLTVAVNVDDRLQFLATLRRWLFWFNLGLMFIAVLLGWLTARLGLRPLRKMTHLASGITSSQLDKRLDATLAPPEIAGAAREFNAMLARLEDSFRRLSAFSSDIAHEIRTPISNLMMQTQYALAREREGEQYREILFANLEELKRLSRMCNDMLFLARSENGLLQLHSGAIRLEEQWRALIEMFEPLTSESGKNIALSGAATVQGDEDMLRRAFSNLLVNAIKYSPERTTISVDILRHDAAVEICVMNATAQLSADNLDRLFDRFWRADGARSQYREGAGLGLSITRAIIQAHGGTLTAQRQGENILFCIRLPH